MSALAEALMKSQVHIAFSMDEDLLDAEEMGVPLAIYKKMKQGYIDTYAVVTDTFEKGYVLPALKRKFTLKGLRY